METKWSRILHSLRKESPNIQKEDGTPIKLGKRLGGGGTKTVYEVEDEERVALVLPNTQNSPTELEHRWPLIENEVELTQKLIRLGFLANPGMKLVEVSCEGERLNTITMTPYDQMSVQVLDGKNYAPRSESHKSGIPTSCDDFRESFKGVDDDIDGLIAAGVRVSTDSINLASTPDGYRIYLNDLTVGGVGASLGGEEQDLLRRQYRRKAVDTFVNNLPDEIYDKHRGFFENLE